MGMGGRKSEWVALESYVDALIALCEAFGDTEPPSRGRLSVLLEAERELRPRLEGLAPKELSRLAWDIGRDLDDFRDMGLELSRLGRREEAAALLEIGDLLFPDEAGISTLLVQGLLGDLDGAVQGLRAIVQERGAVQFRRLSALDALESLGALDAFLDLGFELIREYTRAHDFDGAAATASCLDLALVQLAEQSQSRWGPPHSALPA